MSERTIQITELILRDAHQALMGVAQNKFGDLDSSFRHRFFSDEFAGAIRLFYLIFHCGAGRHQSCGPSCRKVHVGLPTKERAGPGGPAQTWRSAPLERVMRLP